MASPACSTGTIVQEIPIGIPADELFGSLKDRRGSFFLDSGQSSGGLGAWSFIGFDPFLVLSAKDGRIMVRDENGTGVFRGDPLEELRKVWERFRASPESGIPFTGGAVGFLSYELGAGWEGIRATARAVAPDLEFGFYDGVLAFERQSGRAYLVANPVRGDAGLILRCLHGAVREALGHRPRIPSLERVESASTKPRSNFSKMEYVTAVRRIRDYIAAGDVYQVNLTHRFETAFSGDSYALYRRLRRLNPAPFGAYLQTGGTRILCGSPERFLRIRDGRAETRPIKGTRPRGAMPADDARLARELVASDKDRAELLMIVDLERNDLGRVCGFGSIRADELCRLESHPTVHHLVSTVTGRLRQDADVFGCIRAMFPGGSITGAPKIRAMQIIREIETCRRGVYTGAIGYLGFDGGCDLNVAIRTMFCRGGRVWYHVGGGIVWDSDPEAEYQECLDKGRAMHAALMGEDGPPAEVEGI